MQKTFWWFVVCEWKKDEITQLYCYDDISRSCPDVEPSTDSFLNTNFAMNMLELYCTTVFLQSFMRISVMTHYMFA